jgi:hypothetical protein
VLAFVCSSLDFIPLELKLAAMQTILSRIEALRAPKLMGSPFPLPWAMVGNAQRERWQLWQSRQRRIYNLQISLGPQGFESHSLRQPFGISNLRRLFLSTHNGKGLGNVFSDTGFANYSAAFA